MRKGERESEKSTKSIFIKCISERSTSVLPHKNGHVISPKIDTPTWCGMMMIINKNKITKLLAKLRSVSLTFQFSFRSTAGSAAAAVHIFSEFCFGISLIFLAGLDTEFAYIYSNAEHFIIIHSR